MKYRTLILLILLTALILTTCQPVPSSSENISFMVFGDPAELAAYQKLVDSFTQSHPDIQVELIQIPG